jgi:hypothetical protein
MKPYTVRTTQMTVLPEGSPLFHEASTTVSITDEAGGEFVVIEQTVRDGSNGKVEIAPEEWDRLRYAIDSMIAECRKEEE